MKNIHKNNTFDSIQECYLTVVVLVQLGMKHNNKKQLKQLLI